MAKDIKKTIMNKRITLGNLIIKESLIQNKIEYLERELQILEGLE